MSIYYWLRDRVYHQAMAFVAALVYWFPSRQLTVIGVTGTKGKSTVVELVAHILEYAGKKVAVSSSVRNESSGMTMPGRFFMQRLLRRGVRDGCTHAVIEVTSQGVTQSRHRFIAWDAAVFTNLAPEHIEAHGGFEQYRAAKVSFFRYAAKNPRAQFIINNNDANAQYFIDAAHVSKSDFNRIILYDMSDLPSSLLGEFNQYNVGAAVAVAEAMGISRDIIQQAIADFPGVRGRMEFIQKEPFAVVVDYAVTPDSLEAVYKTLKNVKRKAQSAKLLCVFGCTGGGRDHWKRPVMGEIAARYCAIIILTDDDSYDENPAQIAHDIQSGIFNASFPISHVYTIIDRRAAIQKALSLAERGDIVAITGKGGDRWLRQAGGRKISWSDQDIVRDILRGMQNAKRKAQNR